MKKTYLPLLAMGAAAVVLTGCFGATDQADTDDTTQTDTQDTSTTVTSGAYVTVEYVGRISGGEDISTDDILADCDAFEVFDTSDQAIAEACGVYTPQRNYSLPLEVQVGEGKLIPGFENSLYGHEVGDTYSVSIPMAEAYGERSEEYIVEFPLEQLPPKPGATSGEVVDYVAGDEILTPFGPIKVVEVVDGVAKVDANHPLAGKDLIFDIEIVGISDTPTQQAIPTMPEIDMTNEDMSSDDDVDVSDEPVLEQNMEVMDDETAEEANE